MYVLDTNVVSELRKARAGKAAPQVVAWAESVPAALMFLSALTVQELEHGVLLVERSDERAGALLRQWLDLYVLPTFAERILPVDEHVAARAAALHVPDPAPTVGAQPSRPPPWMPPHPAGSPPKPSHPRPPIAQSKPRRRLHTKLAVKNRFIFRLSAWRPPC